MKSDSNVQKIITVQFFKTNNKKVKVGHERVEIGHQNAIDGHKWAIVCGRKRVEGVLKGSKRLIRVEGGYKKVKIGNGRVERGHKRIFCHHISRVAGAGWSRCFWPEPAPKFSSGTGSGFG